MQDDIRVVSELNEVQTLTTNRSYTIEIFSFSNGRYFNEKGLVTVKFPAFIKDYTDSFKSNWTPTELYGRMDPILTYKNTVRTITLSFDIPCESITIAKLNLEQINYLIRGMYPVYDEGARGSAILSSPPMFRVRFANLIKNVANDDDRDTLASGILCSIQNFDFKPVVDNGFYIDEEKNMLYPKLITVSLSLNVIHEHPLGNKKTSTVSGGGQGKLTDAPTEPRVSFFNFPHNAKAKTFIQNNSGAGAQTATGQRPANAQQQAESKNAESGALNNLG